MNTERVAARASGLRRDFHVAVAVACLRLRPLRFCGLHARADRFSGCDPAVPTVRIAPQYLLRYAGKRDARMLQTDGAPACQDR